MNLPVWYEPVWPEQLFISLQSSEKQSYILLSSSTLRGYHITIKCEASRSPFIWQIEQTSTVRPHFDKEFRVLPMQQEI